MLSGTSDRKFLKLLAQNNPAVMVDHIHPATTVDLPYFTGYTQFAAWPTPQLVRNINLFNE